MFQFDINLLAVLAASVAYMVLGMVWYSPILFGGAWIKSMGLSEADIKAMTKDCWKAHLGSFIGSLLTGIVLAYLMNMALIVQLKPALILGFMVWLGFIFPCGLCNVLYEKRPVGAFWITSLYMLVSLLVMCGILSSMPV